VKIQVTQVESSDGLRLSEWFRLTNTEASVASFTQEFLSQLPLNQIQALGFSRPSVNGEFLQHVKCVYVLAEKKGDNYHALA
jgi:hypothetical protein